MNRSLNIRLAKLPYLYLLSYMGLRKQDILLASFPRSGNTWMRFFLCNLISLNEWNGKGVDFPLLNRTMPEFGASNLLRRWPQKTIPRVVKTHKAFQPIFKKNQSIGIIRDPRDVMVSYYHYKKDRYNTFTGSFSEFIRDPLDGLESWFRHYLSWCSHWTLMLKYECIKDNQLHEFKRVLNVLDCPLSEDLVNEAINRSNARTVESADILHKAPSTGDAKFVRSGRTKQWFHYFKESDLSYYHDLTEKHKVFVYIADE